MTAWAVTGDHRHLAYENACALHGILTDALNDLSIQGTNVNLDDLALVLASDSDVVLGERGRRLDAGRVGFAGSQVLAMAAMLGELLPPLAAAAHDATAEWQARNEAADRSAAAKRN